MSLWRHFSRRHELDVLNHVVTDSLKVVITNAHNWQMHLNISFLSYLQIKTREKPPKKTHSEDLRKGFCSGHPKRRKWKLVIIFRILNRKAMQLKTQNIDFQKFKMPWNSDSHLQKTKVCWFYVISTIRVRTFLCQEYVYVYVEIFSKVTITDFRKDFDLLYFYFCVNYYKNSCVRRTCRLEFSTKRLLSELIATQGNHYGTWTCHT